MGICSLIVNNLLSNIYIESLLILAFKLLAKLQQHERDKLKRRLKDELNCNFISSDHEESDDENNNHDYKQDMYILNN